MMLSAKNFTNHGTYLEIFSLFLWCMLHILSKLKDGPTHGAIPSL